MLLAIKLGSLVRLVATVLVVSFILFAMLSHNGATQTPIPPPDPAPTKQA
ncbi:hypothetical protein LWC34_08515 [Kibdelosporangium philippinense]|uniref:Uncharacterized protein n=1 Tax=Kibdelosporangium philippinense TaxID=211113 RepID=A0ABS8Z4N0_9PSEU|nr:hypothetical protein [Kibdelosporangium philippinense]MCE7002873.1 hypothetical protein [Kibdelosporangium philippinense]